MNYNQNIKQRYVNQNVHLNISSLIDNSNIDFWDDIDNLYIYPKLDHPTIEPSFPGGTEKDRADYIDNLDPTNDTIEDYITQLEDLDWECQEIFEWWAVSEHLYNSLKKQGDPVRCNGYLYLWGRTTSGQAILLDHAISKACEQKETK